MKKLLISGLFIMLTMVYAAAGLTTCATADTTTYALHPNVTSNVANTITFQSDEIFSAFVNITPTTTFKLTDFCESFIAVTDTNESLFYPNYDTDEIYVYNTTNSSQLIGPANYTYDSATITWNVAADWNNTNLSVCYNKTFDTSLALTLNTEYTEGTTGTYGDSKTWTLIRTELNSTDWTVWYTYSTRTCSARDSCLATRTVIYSGFALLIVAIIALAAFAIIQIVSGNFDTTVLSVTAIGAVALSIVVMVGYIIVSQVGISICNAAVG